LVLDMAAGAENRALADPLMGAGEVKPGRPPELWRSMPANGEKVWNMRDSDWAKLVLLPGEWRAFMLPRGR